MNTQTAPAIVELGDWKDGEIAALQALAQEQAAMIKYQAEVIASRQAIINRQAALLVAAERGDKGALEAEVHDLCHYIGAPETTLDGEELPLTASVGGYESRLWYARMILETGKEIDKQTATELQVAEAEVRRLRHFKQAAQDALCKCGAGEHQMFCPYWQLVQAESNLLQAESREVADGA